MNRTQIDCFLSAAKTGSISAASKECFLSPQAVSRHIQNLEKELDISLFKRSKNGVLLSPDGVKLYVLVCKMYGNYNHTLKKIKDYYDSISASLSIGISEYVDVLGAISSGIRSFRDKYVNVTMTGQQCRNRVLLENIGNGSLDVAIINEMQIVTNSSFEYRPFAKEDLRLYISADIVDSIPGSATLEDLKTLCQEIPHVSTSYGTWDITEWEEVSHRMSVFLGYDFKKHYNSVNFRSCVLNLRTIPCSVVCDARFGYLPQDNTIFSIPVNTESYLCVLWNRKNENPLIEKLIKHLTDYYKQPLL